MRRWPHFYVTLTLSCSLHRKPFRENWESRKEWYLKRNISLKKYVCSKYLCRASSQTHGLKLKWYSSEKSYLRSVKKKFGEENGSGRRAITDKEWCRLAQLARNGYEGKKRMMWAQTHEQNFYSLSGPYSLFRSRKMVSTRGRRR